MCCCHGNTHHKQLKEYVLLYCYKVFLYFRTILHMYILHDIFFQGTKGASVALLRIIKSETTGNTLHLGIIHGGRYIVFQTSQLMNLVGQDL